MSTPSSAASHYRRIRYEPAWEVDLARLRGGKPAPAEIDEIISEIEPVLSRLCEEYPLVNGTNFRVMSIVAARGLPRLDAWFQVESEECVVCFRLEEVIVAEEEDDDGDDDADVAEAN